MQSDQFKRPRFTQSWDQGTLRDALRDSGFFLLELPGPTVKAIAHLQRLLDAFFKRSTDKKKQFSEPITLVGYRPQGIEYSADPQRPDMMESFSYNSAYGHRLRKLAVDSDLLAITSTAEEVAEGFTETLCRLMGALAADFGVDATSVMDPALYRSGSFLQVNNYTSRHLTRDVLQDPHEDGNLLTLLVSGQAGLQVSKDQKTYHDITTGLNCAIVFGGEILSLLTGKELPAIYHRVVRKVDVSARRSTMFFGNIAQNRHLSLWTSDSNVSSSRLSEMAWSNPSRFGLPDIPATAVKPDE